MPFNVFFEEGIYHIPKIVKKIGTLAVIPSVLLDDTIERIHLHCSHITPGSGAFGAYGKVRKVLKEVIAMFTAHPMRWVGCPYKL